MVTPLVLIPCPDRPKRPAPTALISSASPTKLDPMQRPSAAALDLVLQPNLLWSGPSSARAEFRLGRVQPGLPGRVSRGPSSVFPVGLWGCAPGKPSRGALKYALQTFSQTFGSRAGGGEEIKPSDAEKSAFR